MEAYKEAFIELLARQGVVRFGDFTLKSGRRSPYFINAGELSTGAAIAGLGEAYAARIESAGLDCDLLFGPSYKGVPLAVATAIAMAAAGREVLFAFDRKEAKDHGEGGVFVGGQPAAGMKVVVVDDVITSGLSIRHSISLLRRTESIRNSGVVVAVDREERGRGNRTTLAELELELEVPILPIVTVTELVRYLNERDVAGQRLVDDSRRAAIEAYLERYGAR